MFKWLRTPTPPAIKSLQEENARLRKLNARLINIAAKAIESRDAMQKRLEVHEAKQSERN